MPALGQTTGYTIRKIDGRWQRKVAGKWQTLRVIHNSKQPARHDRRAEGRLPPVSVNKWIWE
jgi:hypothetical protein